MAHLGVLGKTLKSVSCCTPFDEINHSNRPTCFTPAKCMTFTMLEQIISGNINFGKLFLQKGQKEPTQNSFTSSRWAWRTSVSKSPGLSWSVSLSVAPRPQKKVGGSWRLLAFSSSSGVGFFSHTTWQSGSEWPRPRVR